MNNYMTVADGDISAKISSRTPEATLVPLHFRVSIQPVAHLRIFAALHISLDTERGEQWQRVQTQNDPECRV